MGSFLLLDFHKCDCFYNKRKKKINCNRIVAKQYPKSLSIIRELLLKEDFNLHDQDVKRGLLKIDYIDGWVLYRSEYIRFLNILSNLKSLSMCTKLSLLFTIREDEVIPRKISNITDFHDCRTSLKYLYHFSKLCPKAKKTLSQVSK